MHHDSFVTLSASNTPIVPALFQNRAKHEGQGDRLEDGQVNWPVDWKIEWQFDWQDVGQFVGKDGEDSVVRYVNCTVPNTILRVKYTRCINCLGYCLAYTDFDKVILQALR
jgi:hypothetical protein